MGAMFGPIKAFDPTPQADLILELARQNSTSSASSDAVHKARRVMERVMHADIDDALSYQQLTEIAGAAHMVIDVANQLIRWAMDHRATQEQRVMKTLSPMTPDAVKKKRNRRGGGKKRRGGKKHVTH